MSLLSRLALAPIRGIHGRPSAPATIPVKDFLASLGRDLENKVKLEGWEGLRNLRGPDLKKAGLAVKDRRYLLWALEKSRMGQKPSEFAHPPKPKKKYRGWGPCVQHGKRIR